MGAGSSTTSGGPLASQTLQDLTFLEILFAIIVAWVLIDLWQKVLDNFAYRTIGLNRDSTWHTFIVAATATVIFIIYAFLFNNLTGGAVESSIGGGAGSQSNPPPSSNNTDSNNLNQVLAQINGQR